MKRDADPEREWRPTYTYFFRGEKQGWSDLFLHGNVWIDWDRFMPHDDSNTVSEGQGWGTLAYIETLLDIRRRLLATWKECYLDYQLNNVWEAGKIHLRKIGLGDALEGPVSLPICLTRCMDYATKKGFVFPAEEVEMTRKAVTKLLEFRPL